MVNTVVDNKISPGESGGNRSPSKYFLEKDK